MLQNIFLFTWEEKYLLEKEVLRWEKNFIEKFGENTIYTFNNENFNFEEIKQSLFSEWFFIEKKLVIIKGLPLDTDTSNKIPLEISENLTNEIIEKNWKISWNTILLFISYEPDKRNKFYKFLEKNANIKTYKKLSYIELRNFIKNELQWINIDFETIEYFISKIWSNLYTLIHECEKLKIWSSINNNNKIDINVIDTINFWQSETNSFLFFDNFFEEKNKKIKIIENLEKEGTNRNLFLGAFFRGLKWYLHTLDLYKQGITDSKNIANISKQSPFIINKILKNIKKIQEKEQDIKKMYTELILLENKIKSGLLPESYFRLWIKKIIIMT